MVISLSKNSDVPLRQQLAEQIVFLITTGQLKSGEEMPSVRALARRVKVHHNTVSEAYQDLVQREWLTGRRGSRLTVGAGSGARRQVPSNLDELINESIKRAKDMGYSLQALRARVRERLLAQPPDHILVVEEEQGLREIIRREVQENLGWPVEGCSPEQFAKESALAIGAQVFAPNHIIEYLKPLLPSQRPAISITYSSADEHLAIICKLTMPSIVAVASVSESLLKTARGLFAPAIGRKHVFQEYLLPMNNKLKLEGADVVFCDSLAMKLVSCRHKVHYQLIPSDCLEYLATTVAPNL
ncbi:MAG TPA: GntR family transcriptional regulator [Acidobacteriaceae bacterium]